MKRRKRFDWGVNSTPFLPALSCGRTGRRPGSQLRQFLDDPPSILRREGLSVMRNRARKMMVVGLLAGTVVVGCGSEDPSHAGGASGAAFAGNWKCTTKGTDVTANVSTTFDSVYVGQD